MKQKVAKVRGRTKGRKKAKMERLEKQRANPSLHQPTSLGERCANSGCAAAIVGKVTNAQIVIRHLATCSKQDLANLGIHADLLTLKTPKISQQNAASKFRKNRSPKLLKIKPQSHQNGARQEPWLAGHPWAYHQAFWYGGMGSST